MPGQEFPAPPNFIRSRLLARIIRRESALIAFAQSRWLSFLFALRVPSETLQIRRDYRGDGISAFSPPSEKAMVGIRESPDGWFVIRRLKRRKNLTGGCALRRPCFCSVDRPAAATLCPVHAL